MYGMNFFGFDSTSRSIVIGDDFWIFIATWLPLTFITAAVVFIVRFIHERMKRKSRYVAEGLKRIY